MKKMPHVVFDKKIDLKKLSEEFTKVFQKEPNIIKIENIFVDKDNRTALLPTVVIENDNQNFFIEISTTDSKSTIRLHPRTDPEKTPGVKTAMGLVANQIQSIFDVSITKTNIQDFIPK